MSPQETIQRGLQAMARALTKANAWTPQARVGYEAASLAVPQLGQVVDVAPIALSDRDGGAFSKISDPRDEPER